MFFFFAVSHCAHQNSSVLSGKEFSMFKKKPPVVLPPDTEDDPKLFGIGLSGAFGFHRTVL